MLPVTLKSELDIEPIEWLGLPREYQNAGEIEILVALARSVEARAILEIGCNRGRTARLLLHNVSTLEVYHGIDVPQTYQPQLAHQLREIPARPGEFAFADPRFELFMRDRGSFDLTASDLSRYDMVYVDGDHGDRAVRHDSQLANEVTRPGGLIVWHDYHNGSTVDVKVIIDELAMSGWPIRLIEKTWFAYCARVCDLR
jgi:predicted O-methyltransferase YrrM